MTVRARFQTLLDRLALSEAEVAAYARHVNTVTLKIVAAVPDAKVRMIGSRARGTAIHGSDVDLLAILPQKFVTWGHHPKSPSSVIANLKAALRERLPNTVTRKDGQALVVHFSDGRTIDVVPGSFDGMSTQRPSRPTYTIPRGAESWRKASPDGHNLYLQKASDAARGKLRGAAKILKFWRTRRGLALQSFYVEMLLATTEVSVGARSYATVFALALRALHRCECRSVIDPVGISPRIAAATTEVLRRELFDAVRSSLGWARRAIVAEGEGRLSEAYDYWDHVFVGEFPKR